ncbi:metabotropic glutamate receptor 3-like [Physella acuta]|uniref:metabotropic glutamate receptor 3-like n=1 Tax=Physella acuta TaxID=109671 RepID=UPI0027DD882B|nr:metabotropic glutamate receptor 3-like [Physella acuta]
MAADVLSVVGFLLMVTCCHHGVMPTRKLVKTKLSDMKYYQDGDLLIGGILATEMRRDGGMFFVPNDFSFHLVESVTYAINLVNRNKSMLPNVKLGFIMLDDHFATDAAVLRAIGFMKQRRSRLNKQCVMNADSRDSIVSYDVVGVIGCLQSKTSEAAGLILSGANVPLLSFTATSPALSDKEKYPYFLRVIPEYSMNIEAVFEFLLLQNWTYISVMYSDGTYGEGMYEKLREKTRKDFRICLAKEMKFYTYSTQENYADAIQDVKILGNSRVVLTFLEEYSAHALVASIIQSKEAGWLVWVMNEPFLNRVLDLFNYNDYDSVRLFVGSVYLGFKTYTTEGYNGHLSALRPDTHTNPWFKKYWMDLNRCERLDKECLKHNVEELHGAYTFRFASVAQRAVFAVAFGIDRVIKKYCPLADKRELPECVTGPRLLKVKHKAAPV